MVSENARYSRMAGRDRDQGTSGFDPPKGNLPRGLPFVPRPENHPPAAPGSQSHPGARAGGITRINLVLWQRRHLQHHSARDGAKTPEAQNGQYSDNQGPSRSVGQPGVLDTITGERPGGEFESENRPSDFSPGAGLSRKRNAVLKG